MPLPLLPFGTLISSKQLVSGNHINGFNNLLTGTATNLVATPGGGTGAAGAAGSLRLNSAFNDVATVATVNDSVTLPPAKSGLRIVVNNNGAQTLTVYADAADTYQNNSGAVNPSSTVLAANCAIFIAIKDGVWRRLSFA